MIKSINAGFDAPLSPDDTTQMQAMRLQGVRVELPPNATQDVILGRLLPFLGTGLSLRILLHGEAMTVDQTCTQAVTVATHARSIGLRLSGGIEPFNEPNIHDVSAEDCARVVIAVFRALEMIGFEDDVLGGSVSNLHEEEGQRYLEAMQWHLIPRDIKVAAHDYDRRNMPAPKLVVQERIVACMQVTGRQGEPPDITEMGYHGAVTTAKLEKFPPYFFPDNRLTEEERAEALFNKLQWYAEWGIPRADIFQWNCGAAKDRFDHEAMYGVRGYTQATGARPWLPQGIMLAQIGDL